MTMLGSTGAIPVQHPASTSLGTINSGISSLVGSTAKGAADALTNTPTPSSAPFSATGGAGAGEMGQSSVGAKVSGAAAAPTLTTGAQQYINYVSGKSGGDPTKNAAKWAGTLTDADWASLAAYYGLNPNDAPPSAIAGNSAYQKAAAAYGSQTSGQYGGLINNSAADGLNTTPTGNQQQQQNLAHSASNLVGSLNIPQTADGVANAKSILAKMQAQMGGITDPVAFGIYQTAITNIGNEIQTASDAVTKAAGDAQAEQGVEDAGSKASSAALATYSDAIKNSAGLVGTAENTAQQTLGQDLAANSANQQNLEQTGDLENAEVAGGVADAQTQGSVNAGEDVAVANAFQTQAQTNVSALTQLATSLQGIQGLTTSDQLQVMGQSAQTLVNGVQQAIQDGQIAAGAQTNALQQMLQEYSNENATAAQKASAFNSILGMVIGGASAIGGIAATVFSGGTLAPVGAALIAGGVGEIANSAKG